MAFVADPEGNLVELLSRGGAAMRILGLGGGVPGGSAEILLTAALRARRHGADAELVRLSDVAIDADGGGCGNGSSSATG